MSDVRLMMVGMIQKVRRKKYQRKKGMMRDQRPRQIMRQRIQSLNEEFVGGMNRVGYLTWCHGRKGSA